MSRNLGRNERMDAMFSETPEVFHQAFHEAIRSLPEAPVRKPLRIAALAALLILLLCGAAWAARHWGVLEMLSEAGRTAQPSAVDLVERPDSESTTLAGVTFAPFEALYDGECVYVAMKMASKSTPLLSDMIWTEDQPNVPVGPYARVGFIIRSINGLDVTQNQWQTDSDGRAGEDGSYGWFSVRCGSVEPPVQVEIDLYVIRFDPEHNERIWGQTVLTVNGGLSSGSRQEARLGEQGIQNGVELTALQLVYTPMDARLTVWYRIDPELDRFERMRREGMRLTVLDEQGEALGGVDRPAAADGIWRVVRTLPDLEAPPEALTIAFVGRDTEEYGRFTVQLTYEGSLEK